MAEMLLEFWSQKPDDDEAKRSWTQRPQQVTEIFTWIQCFVSYKSVLSTRFHDCVPELKAYMVMITCVSRDFAGLAWVRYDASFRGKPRLWGTRSGPKSTRLCIRFVLQEVLRCNHDASCA